MISTIAVEYPREVFHTSDSQRSQNSNKAGVPLSIIPRRAQISRSSRKRPTISLRSDRRGCASVDSDFSSNSSDGSLSNSRSCRKNLEEVRFNTTSLLKPISILSSPHPSTLTCPRRNAQRVFDDQSEYASTIAAPRPLVYIPGMLHSSVETIRSHMLSNSRHDPRSLLGNGSKSAPPQGNGSDRGPRFIQKKRAQPIKSSLKSSRCTRGNLSVVTMGSSSKSEPPTPKVVHFDPQLEHVKLFLAEQKPLAISRDGSPTEDTSGTDSDFPSFIYGHGNGTHHSRKRFVMQPINPISKPNASLNVALEEFYLNPDGTTVLGKVRVRNIAFVKIVVVRFTFDAWQTISEVTAHYVESFDRHYDRFSFSIRLNDLLPKIEGKTLVMAIRYNVAGQEFWDNNYHQNYAATFTKAKASRETTTFDNDMETLGSRLERVALHGDTDNPVVAPKSSMPQFNETPPSLKSTFTLSSRYDFATSLRDNVRKHVDDPSSHQDARSLSTRSSTYPIFPSLVHCPEKASPPKRLTTLSMPSSDVRLVTSRDLDEEHPMRMQSLPDKPDNVSSFDRGRNRRRGFSADGTLTGSTSAVRKTSLGISKSKPSYLPMTSTSLFPCHSSSPVMNLNVSSQLDPCGLDHIREPSCIGRRLPSALVPEGLHQGLDPNLGESSGDSELSSTPSLSTPDSSRSPTPSPTISFKRSASSPFFNELYPDTNHDMSHPTQLVSPGNHYTHFLSK